MVVKRNVIKNIKFTDTDICEDYFFKCKLLKKVKTAHRLNKFLTRYRIRKKNLYKVITLKLLLDLEN